MDVKKYGPWALIAGASDGIGEAFARQLAKHSFNLLLLARRGETLGALAALSGGSYTAAYNATKSFDLILAESLWHELAPRAVDAMCLMAGATLTPSMLSSKDNFSEYPNAMDPADVAREGLQHLGKGPVWVAGSHNREAAKMLWPIPRTVAINGFSEAAAGLYELPFTHVEGEDFHNA